MKPSVHFAHGKESGPWGSKIIHLAGIARASGCEAESLDYAGIDDPQVRANKLADACAGDSGKLILVGSSMGGWVATAASNRVKPLGLFLLAPAFYLPGYPDVSPLCAPANLELIHGWGDEVIPYAHSVRFGQRHGCTVHLIDGDHRLGGRLDLIGGYFAIFLKRLLHEQC
jgi:predicted alpha/beta-hydrolase family hydrolase